MRKSYSHSYVSHTRWQVIPQQALLLYHIHIMAFKYAWRSVDWGSSPRQIRSIAANLGTRWGR